MHSVVSADGCPRRYIKTKLEWALEHARRGFRVFPLSDDGKTPRKGFDNWQQQATCDPEQITRWWRKWPNANVGGVLDHKTVVDIDPRNGGTTTFEFLQILEDWPETLKQQTQSGGQHLFFEGESSRKCLLGAGAERLTKNCYVLLPGSIVGGRQYAWLNDLPMAPVMPWLRDFGNANAGNGSVAPNGNGGVHRLGEETAEAIEAARLWLDTSAEIVHQGARDNTAFQVAARLYDYGLEESTVFAMLCDWNVTYCIPPLDGDAIERIAGSARVHRQNNIGVRTTDSGFEAVETTIVKNVADIPLTGLDWEIRDDLSEPDLLLGHWLTTTTRCLLVAATGLGKTNFGMAIAIASAAGMPFLHWEGRRPARVLYVDGEMSRRLLKIRILDAKRRLGIMPEGFHAFSHEDLESFAPLNMEQGQECIEALIRRIGNLDLIVFDSVMCLTLGDMKEEESWSQTLPWVRSLTRRNIGQVWIHHTGHDTTRLYGTNTRGWQMDTIMLLEENKREDTDLSFTLNFPKARERTPETRGDFFPAEIALVIDHWCTNNISSELVISKKARELFSLLKQNVHSEMDIDYGHSGQKMDIPYTWQSIVEIIEEKCPEKRWTRPSITRWLEELVQKKMVKKTSRNQYVI